MKMTLFYKGAKRPKTAKPLRYAVRRKVKLKLQCLMSWLRMDKGYETIRENLVENGDWEQLISL